jgi:hypothetical protein
MGDIPSIQHFIIPALQFKIELPRSKLTGYKNIAMRIYPKGVTPKCFNRGSSLGLALDSRRFENLTVPREIEA